jgi:hypothetical protein
VKIRPAASALRLHEEGIPVPRKGAATSVFPPPPLPPPTKIQSKSNIKFMVWPPNRRAVVTSCYFAVIRRMWQLEELTVIYWKIWQALSAGTPQDFECKTFD